MIDPTRLSEECDRIAREFRDMKKVQKQELNRIFEEKMKAAGAEIGVPPDLAILLGHRGVSVFQGNKPRAGNMLELAAAPLFSEVVGADNVHRHWKLPGRNNKTIDIVIETRQRWYFLSLKVSTAERAGETWPSEHALVKKFCERGDIRYRFIGLSREPIDNHLRAHLRLPVEYMSTMDHDSLSGLVEDIWEDNQ